MKQRFLALDRRFVVAAVLGSLISVLAFAAIVTAGTFNLTGTTNAAGGTTAGFYDAQAKALLDGNWDVPDNAINGEAFIIGEKRYGYFGPTPALLRIPILLVAPRAQGQLNVLAVLSAVTMILVFTSRLTWALRRRALGEMAWTRTEAWLLGSFLAFLVPATTLMFLASFSFVYHEAILWGIAFALATTYYTVRYIESPSWALAARTIVATSLALLARPSTGLSALAIFGLPVAILLFVTIDPPIANRRLSTRMRYASGMDALNVSRKAVLVLAGSLLVPLLLATSVNMAKFGTPFSVPFAQHVGIASDPARLENMRRIGGLLSPRFIPTNLVQYSRPDALHFGTTPPWISFRFGPWTQLTAGSLRYDGIEKHSSVPATMPALTALAVAGVFQVFRRRRRHPSNPYLILRVPIVGAAIGGLINLSAAGITHRYIADFLVLLIPLGVIGLVRVMSWKPSTNLLQPLGIIALAFAAIFGTTTNIALAVNYQNTAHETPPAARVRYQKIIGNLDHVFDTSQPAMYRNPHGTPPVGARPGSLWLPAGCSRLLWSDGERWLPISNTEVSGAQVFDMVVEPGPAGLTEPVVVRGSRGAADVLGIRHLDERTIVFTIDHMGAPPLDGMPVRFDPAVSHRVAIEFNPEAHHVSVTFDGIEVLNTPLDFYPGNADVVVGRNDVGASAAPRFGGQIRPAVTALDCPP